MLEQGEIKNIGFSGIKDHYQAIGEIMKRLGNYKGKIKAVGHRYVNGGTEFFEPEILDREKLKKLKKYNKLAPLHNPYNFSGIEAVMDFMPEAKNVAVFDTYFYKDLPQKAWRYALNKQVADKNNYRRLGFHGISHEYALEAAARELGEKPEKMSLISIHLGGGASITAVKNGKAIDTSMGWTPLEGLMMMTRCGDLDAGIILDLMRQGMKKEAIDELLNQKSGLYGLCGKQAMLDVLDNLDDPAVKLAFDIFIYRIKKYVGAYWAVLEGCKAIVFTGTVGAGRPETREAIMKGMSCLGKIRVLTVKTDEEKIIARQTRKKV